MADQESNLTAEQDRIARQEHKISRMSPDDPTLSVERRLLDRMRSIVEKGAKANSDHVIPGEGPFDDNE